MASDLLASLSFGNFATENGNDSKQVVLLWPYSGYASYRPKSHLPAYGWGKMLATHIYHRSMAGRRSIIIKLCASPEEKAMFEQKALAYQGNVSAMIRDAVEQFNDIRTQNKIKVMTELMRFYKRYQQDLSWLGGNFNQAMKRANELALSGELTENYIDGELKPRLDELKPLLVGIKDSLSEISDFIR